MSELKLVRHPETNEIIPEIWKDIERYEGYYQVSNYGRVKSLHYGKNKILKQSNHGKGYRVVHFNKNGESRNFTVHRLVAKAFISNPENKGCVNHKDFDKANNHVGNLEWVTSYENVQHAIDAGRMTFSGIRDLRGEDHGMSKLTEKDVRGIKKLLNRGIIQRKIAQRYGVSRSTIKEINRGTTWTHV